MTIHDSIPIDSLHPPKAIGFDLDLTLYNLTSFYDYSLNQTISHFRGNKLSKEQLKQVRGVNFTSYIEIFTKQISEELAKQAEEYHINKLLSSTIPQKSIIPGTRKLLYTIKKKYNLPIIGVTNSEEVIAKKFLYDLNILKSFDYLIGAGRNIPLKPSSEMLLTGLKFISILPGPHVWFIGDSPHDTKCAKQINCSAIRFYHRKKPEDLHADLFINNHHHLCDLIKEKFKC